MRGRDMTTNTLEYHTKITVKETNNGEFKVVADETGGEILLSGGISSKAAANDLARICCRVAIIERGTMN